MAEYAARRRASGKDKESYQRCKDSPTYRRKLHRATWRRRAVRFMNEIAKTNPCKDCGLRWPGLVMEWDHRPGTVKKRDVSKIVLNSWRGFVEEIAKCDLVCANCHRIRTIHRGHPE